MNPNQYLNEIEQEKIASFNADPILREAVKKAILAGIYINGTLKPGEPAKPMTNWALSFGQTTPGNNISDEVLGQNVRAYSWALNTVEAAFQKLETVLPKAPQEGGKKKKNPAI